MYLGKISVTMEFLSGKVVIVIIACVSVIIISSIVIPIAVVFSGGESKITLTTTTEEGKSNSSKLTLFEFLLKKILTTNSLPITLIQFPNMEQDPQCQLK